ncbi:MAG: hypothetical protein Q9225_003039 [Loekoesia sp. 1 TL-2023]
MEQLIAAGHPSHELTCQFCMTPAIADLPNALFYRNQIRTQQPESSSSIELMFMEAISKFTNGQVESTTVWVDYLNTNMTTVGGRQSKQNDMEVFAACALGMRCIEEGIPADQITFLTPYVAQREAFYRAIGRTPELKGAITNTVDGYQGEENAIVIFTLTTRLKPGFMKNCKRCNVAWTRAKYALVIIGDVPSLENWKNKRSTHKPEWCKTVNYIGGVRLDPQMYVHQQ